MSTHRNMSCWRVAILTTNSSTIRFSKPFMPRRTAMDSKTRKKWEVRLAVLILFVTGFIAGGLAMNLYHSRDWSPRSGRGSFEHVLDKLNLTQDQRVEVTAIFEDARKQLNEL